LFSGSIITIPPSCASASTCSTPARRAPHPQAPRRGASPAHAVRHERAGRARHDLALREVAGEEVVVGAHALVADRVALRLQLHHAVDEQEGVPARAALSAGNELCTAAAPGPARTGAAGPPGWPRCPSARQRPGPSSRRASPPRARPRPRRSLAPAPPWRAQRGRSRCAERTAGRLGAHRPPRPTRPCEKAQTRLAEDHTGGNAAPGQPGRAWPRRLCKAQAVPRLGVCRRRAPGRARPPRHALHGCRRCWATDTGALQTFGRGAREGWTACTCPSRFALGVSSWAAAFWEALWQESFPSALRGRPMLSCAVGGQSSANAGTSGHAGTREQAKVQLPGTELRAAAAVPL